MPSYVDFNASKQFRDFVLTKTLTVPNGPQTFNESNYSVHNLNTYPNVDSGDVEDTRPSELLQSQNVNTFKPIEYLVTENLNVFTRKANLNLYPHFETGQNHNLIGIMGNPSYETESELFKFAAWNINTNPQGPVFARIQQNLYATTVGKVRLLDALNGNLATATNLVTGREPLIESNPRITVASTLPGKGIDFLQTVAGVEFPWSEIPGNYLSNPRNPIEGNIRPEARTEAGRLIQDATGALGSLIGIQRRPTLTTKPSDLLIEYTGQRQKSLLFDNLSYSKYAPDYTTTARSQNTSKLFNMVDRFSQSVKNLIGLEAPKGVAYIGDDRGDDVKYATNDLNERPVRSSYFLSIMFDDAQRILFKESRNIGEGGNIGGGLTWISTKSRNLLGANNKEFNIQGSQFTDSLSTNRNFRSDSILGITQEILESMPSDGGAARSHVGNVIDQTSRIFREGDVMLSRGSAIKYVDQYTGKESGVEYCRVWTKDRSYLNNSDTMKRSGNLRKYESSVLNAPWNLNIYPNSNAKGEFDTSSTNMGQREGGFFAKKYMFSIENLAWKTSNTPGFSYSDLPYCERGPNGGRIMWFPPYGLKINEVNNAKWESNTFLGRPEPIYTYQNTERNGTVSFKVIVDHPSILNLLVKKHFEGMSDAEADNYINAFFAGCQNIDFYGLIRRYATLSPDDGNAVMAYLNENKDPQPVENNKSSLPPVISDTPVPENSPALEEYSVNLYFENDAPVLEPGDPLYTKSPYYEFYVNYTYNKDAILLDLDAGLTQLANSPVWGNDQINDYYLLTGIPNKKDRPEESEFADMLYNSGIELNKGFDLLESEYMRYVVQTYSLRDLLKEGKIKNIYIRVGSSTSSADSANNNLKLSYRRSYSVIHDFLFRIHNSAKISGVDGVLEKYVNWSTSITDTDFRIIEPKIEIPLKELGYDQKGILLIDNVYNVGEAAMATNSQVSDQTNVTCSESSGFLTSEYLLRSAPSAFYCRNTSIGVKYERGDAETDDTVNDNADEIAAAQQKLVELNGDSPTNVKLSPSIDEMKRIVMKVLSECYYFRKLEEDSPTQFSSLREKLKYFHPSFHSMTPEGLNTRLTFLHQCIRPGDTLPIKGISDDADVNARNTTFGPPPICVMRIGDFYNSKIVIRDVNIDFDDGIWDFNPEGIGVQPMIANVTLQISFIGGHGLERPVERLQNALSSNFYANTEMYDPRSKSTEDRKTFTKEFLDSLNQRSDVPLSKTNSQDMLTSTNNVVQGAYIGTPGNSLDYTTIVEDLYSQIESYFKKYEQAYNFVTTTYGNKFASLFLSPDYRSIKDYVVQTGVGTEAIELLGNYPIRSEFEVFIQNFNILISGKTITENISEIMGISNDMTNSVASKSEDILKPYILKTLIEVINDTSTANTYIKSVELARDNIIKNLDKLNFIVEYEYDGKIENTKYTGINITGFTSTTFYETYSSIISFINNNQYKFTEDLDTTYNFYNLTMSTDDFSYFLSILLRNKKNNILNLYKNNKAFNIKSIERRLNKFFTSAPSVKNFGIKKYPARKDNNSLAFDTTTEFDIADSTEIENLTKTHNTKGYRSTEFLNYYRPAFGTSG